MAFPESYTPADELLALEGTALAWIESHQDAGESLLLPQFRDKPRLVAMLRAILDAVQELDDCVWQVLTGRWLPNAVGVQLDELGWIVGLPRYWDDDTYRVLIGATILVLRSSGTWPDFFEVLEAVGLTLALVEVDQPGIAAMRIILGEPLDGDISARDLFQLLLRRMPGAGIRFVLEFPTVAVDDTLTWADAEIGGTIVDDAGDPFLTDLGEVFVTSDGDPAQVDARRGWPDDDATTGGVWADCLATVDEVFNFPESTTP